jgi:pimeloyl-ACP methyl ester carboxylesterase
MTEAGPAARLPVQLFNAGYCSYRSFQFELLKQINQPTLILQGQDDKRNHSDLGQLLPTCHILRISGKNILPWESPEECCQAIQQFLHSVLYD